ncbi:MAG: glycoside hydrolase family 15 protein [Desulfococcus multivorans]|jgi:phosphorylase kinase alpha/beta subunit|uniref:glycoside hydrolase family 15 protein n=1 Tax=Desulfococcus sp. TaxID=2025834 RepID=UPI002A4D09DB|nr:glycoside hydrolase family 15 protein [Desulfococcus multivorans]
MKKKDELIAGYLLDRYGREDAVKLYGFLRSHGTFDFKRLGNGLFPATTAPDQDSSGYQYVWVRDNVHIAHAHYQWGDIAAAAQTAETLMTFFQSQRKRMRAIIQDPLLASDPMNRPHVRFDGRRLRELDQKWAHAQNDALGYFLWFYSRLAKAKAVPWTEDEQACLTDLVAYFQTIRYWEDKDSGHWEEERKVSASSIGTVVAGLREFSGLDGNAGPDVAGLRARGETVLETILPYESRPSRRYDAALLFLIYPLNVVSRDQAAVILRDVKENLEGHIGIRRYLNDSYWCPDYRKIFKTKERTRDFSDTMQARDAHIRFGREAQWCIFDALISCIYAHQPSLTKDGEGLQAYHLNRALRQLTESADGRLLCPEAYFLEKNAYTPNDHVPLQWAQANLRLAIHFFCTPAESHPDRLRFPVRFTRP